MAFGFQSASSLNPRESENVRNATAEALAVSKQRGGVAEKSELLLKTLKKMWQTLQQKLRYVEVCKLKLNPKNLNYCN